MRKMEKVQERELRFLLNDSFASYEQLLIVSGIHVCRIRALATDGWMNQAYSRLSTTHGHITDCKLVRMYWTRLVLVRPAASLYSASPLKHHPTGKQ